MLHTNLTNVSSIVEPTLKGRNMKSLDENLNTVEDSRARKYECSKETEPEETPVCNNECKIRGSDAPWCHEEKNAYVCTRLKNHIGPHVACGDTVHCLCVWGEDE